MNMTLLEEYEKAANRAAYQYAKSNTTEDYEAFSQAEAILKAFTRSETPSVQFNVTSLKCCGGSVLDMFGKINIKMSTVDIDVHPTVSASLHTDVTIKETYNHIHTINHLATDCTTPGGCVGETTNSTSSIYN